MVLEYLSKTMSLIVAMLKCRRNDAYDLSE